eukprot:Em0016g414a
MLRAALTLSFFRFQRVGEFTMKNMSFNPRDGTPLTAMFFPSTFLHLIEPCGFDAANTRHIPITPLTHPLDTRTMAAAQLSGTRHSCYMSDCGSRLPPLWAKLNHEPKHADRVLTYHNLHDRVATIKFIAKDIALRFVWLFSIKKRQHTVLQVTLVVCRE